MENAEVAPTARDSSLRLARAVLLLASGVAAHMWLGGGLHLPGLRPAGMMTSTAVRQHAAGQQTIAATSGSAGVLAIASTLGESVGARPPAAPDLDARADTSARGAADGVRADATRDAEGLADETAITAEATNDEVEVQEKQHHQDNEQPLIAAPREGAEPALPVAVAAPPSGRGGAVRAPSAPAVQSPTPAPIAGLAARRAASPLASEAEHPDTVAPPSDEALVSHVLQQYRVAYERLDVDAARHIWPSVDARALDSAFRQLAEQRLTFQSCGVSVSGSGDEATARCRGRAEYVPKVGSRRARAADAEWVFDLAKQDTDWRIVSANASVK